MTVNNSALSMAAATAPANPKAWQLHREQLHQLRKTQSLPASADDVDLAMRTMDKTHGTSFTAWIKSEQNIPYICAFKKDVIVDNLVCRPQQAIHALQWMTADWSTTSVAELVLKLFYDRHIDSPDFARIIAGIRDDWSLEKTADLVNVLLIGESAVSAAAFLVHLTDQSGICSHETTVDIAVHRWANDDRISLVRSVARSLRWKDAFLQTFLLEYATFSLADLDRRHALSRVVYQEFENRSMSRAVSRTLEQMADRLDGHAIKRAHRADAPGNGDMELVASLIRAVNDSDNGSDADSDGDEDNDEDSMYMTEDEELIQEVVQAITQDDDDNDHRAPPSIVVQQHAGADQSAGKSYTDEMDTASTPMSATTPLTALSIVSPFAGMLPGQTRTSPMSPALSDVQSSVASPAALSETRSPVSSDGLQSPTTAPQPASFNRLFDTIGHESFSSLVPSLEQDLATLESFYSDLAPTLGSVSPLMPRYADRMHLFTELFELILVASDIEDLEGIMHDLRLAKSTHSPTMALLRRVDSGCESE